MRFYAIIIQFNWHPYTIFGGGVKSPPWLHWISPWWQITARQFSAVNDWHIKQVNRESIDIWQPFPLQCYFIVISWCYYIIKFYWNFLLLICLFHLVLPIFPSLKRNKEIFHGSKEYVEYTPCNDNLRAITYLVDQTVISMICGMFSDDVPLKFNDLLCI